MDLAERLGALRREAMKKIEGAVKVAILLRSSSTPVDLRR